jgi:hypothetical protein
MKRFLIAATFVAGALYCADQYFAAGKYTSAVGQLATHMRRSFRI